MKAPNLTELALLPEEEAVQRDFDYHNWRLLRWLLAAALFASFVMAVSFANPRYPSGRFMWQPVLAFAHTAFVLAVFLSRSRRWFERRFRTMYLLYVAVEFVFACVIFFGVPTPFIFSQALFPAIAAVSRLRLREYVYLGGLFLAMNAVSAFMLLRGSILSLVGRGVILPGLAIGTILAIALAFARAHRQRFVEQWRVAASREHERLRLQDELELARQIQVSMLPEAAPQVGWLDIASTSLTATEVGGDFYDFYELDEHRIALVVGDVAGHGVPSGLVLAAMKAGLFLLRDRLRNPVEATAALNAMIRDAIRWRMLVSVAIAVVDRERMELSVVSAGHPPLLLRSGRERRVITVGHGSLPLGTSLPTLYTAETTAIEAGDVLVLATDGFTELSRDGEMFGEERLRTLLRDAAGSAGDIRDALLANLRQFGGSAPLDDDVTLLVANVR